MNDSRSIVSKNELQAFVYWLLLLTLSGTRAHPLDCDGEQGGAVRCPSISQDQLLDRVIRLAELMYQVSEESCALFEETFIPFPWQSQRNPGGSVCTSKSFLIPRSKSDIQQISEKWLLHSVLMLVQSWIEPLVYLQTTLGHYDNAPVALLNKTKWMSDKLLSLEQGVVVLVRKMLDEGTLAAAENNRRPVSYDTAPEMLESVLRDYTVFSCFKKDAHKMETFLKLLKCRQTDNFGCSLF